MALIYCAVWLWTTIDTALYTTPCTLNTAECAQYTEPHCTAHFTLNPAHISHFTLYTAHNALHTAHSIRKTTECTLHTAHCTLHTAHCTLHTAHYIPTKGSALNTNCTIRWNFFPSTPNSMQNPPEPKRTNLAFSAIIHYKLHTVLYTLYTTQWTLN